MKSLRTAIRTEEWKTAYSDSNDCSPSYIHIKYFTQFTLVQLKNYPEKNRVLHIIPFTWCIN